MKKKDLIYVFLAVGIIAVAAYLAMTQLSPKNTAGSAKAGTVVDVIGPISDQLNQDGLSQVQDPTKAVDYTVTVDLTTGLGNTAPFGR
jgi:hypothetical protein